MKKQLLLLAFQWLGTMDVGNWNQKYRTFSQNYYQSSVDQTITYIPQNQDFFLFINIPTHKDQYIVTSHYYFSQGGAMEFNIVKDKTLSIFNYSNKNHKNFFALVNQNNKLFFNGLNGDSINQMALLLAPCPNYSIYNNNQFQYKMCKGSRLLVQGPTNDLALFNGDGLITIVNGHVINSYHKNIFQINNFIQWSSFNQNFGWGENNVNTTLFFKTNGPKTLLYYCFMDGFKEDFFFYPTDKFSHCKQFQLDNFFNPIQLVYHCFQWSHYLLALRFNDQTQWIDICNSFFKQSIFLPPQNSLANTEINSVFTAVECPANGYDFLLMFNFFVVFIIQMGFHCNFFCLLNGKFPNNVFKNIINYKTYFILQRLFFDNIVLLNLLSINLFILLKSTTWQLSTLTNDLNYIYWIMMVLQGCLLFVELMNYIKVIFNHCNKTPYYYNGEYVDFLMMNFLDKKNNTFIDHNKKLNTISLRNLKDIKSLMDLYLSFYEQWLLEKQKSSPLNGNINSSIVEIPLDNNIQLSLPLDQLKKDFIEKFPKNTHKNFTNNLLTTEYLVGLIIESDPLVDVNIKFWYWVFSSLEYYFFKTNIMDPSPNPSPIKELILHNEQFYTNYKWLIFNLVIFAMNLLNFIYFFNFLGLSN